MKLTDSGTLIRLAYQGLLDMKIDADDILFRAGFNKSKLYEINLRTPFSAQPYFGIAQSKFQAIQQSDSI